jgi:hypothetical protein
VQKREAPPAVQALFDGPSAAAESCPRRQVSTAPPQALYLLNNAFALDRARGLARRVLQEAGDDRRRQVEAAFRRTLGRPPEDTERDAALAFLSRGCDDGSVSAPATVLVQFCQALLNVNEFVYIE